MKRLIIVTFTIFVPHLLAAQTISYGYDNAGNRVRREIVMQTRALLKEEAMPKLSEEIFGRKITISPNPTEGILIVEIGNFESIYNCKLEIYQISGSKLLSTQVPKKMTTLDISSYTNGMYILAITINGDTATWKIIKK